MLDLDTFKTPMVELIQAEVFHDFQTKGYSRPARVTCRRPNGETVEVFVKFSGGVRNHHLGLTAELVCSRLARVLGLDTPQPFIVNLTEEFLEGVPMDAKDLVWRSLGLNFASQGAGVGFRVVPTEPRIPVSLRSRAADVFAFDVLIQNFDRKGDNPNMLWTRESILLIDHESALKLAFTPQSFNWSTLSLDSFYDHVFYQAITSADAGLMKIEDGLRQLGEDGVTSLLADIPEAWRSHEAGLSLARYLEWLVGSRTIVCKLIRERIS